MTPQVPPPSELSVYSSGIDQPVRPVKFAEFVPSQRYWLPAVATLATTQYFVFVASNCGVDRVKVIWEGVVVMVPGLVKANSEEAGLPEMVLEL
jgi:hypothetical protein